MQREVYVENSAKNVDNSAAKSLQTRLLKSRKNLGNSAGALEEKRPCL